MARDEESLADSAWEARLRALGIALARVERANRSNAAETVRITELRAKLDQDNRTSVLLVIKGVSKDDALVAFVGGPDLTGAVLALGQKMRAGVLRWRPDRPWAGS